MNGQNTSIKIKKNCQVGVNSILQQETHSEGKVKGWERYTLATPNQETWSDYINIK